MKKLLIIITCLISLGVQGQDKTLTVRRTSNGTIIGVDPSAVRDTLLKVSINGLANGDILQSSGGKWVNVALSTIVPVGLADSLAKKANRTFDNVASGAIANVKLANSTISGVPLGSNLNTLTLGDGLTGTSYNGSNAVTARSDTAVVRTVANSVSLSGLQTRLNAYLPLAGGTLTGHLIGKTSAWQGTNSAYTSIFTGGSGTGASFGLKIEAGTNGSDFAIFVANQNLSASLFGIKGDGSIMAFNLGGSGNVIVGADNTGLLGKITIGSGLSLVGGTLSATGGSSGTVTTPGMTAGRIVVANSASDIGTTTALTISGSDLSVTGGVTATSFIGPLTGNASTATALQTARTINGTSFDGTGNVTVTASAGTLTGSTLNSTVTGSSLTSVGTLTSLSTGATTINTSENHVRMENGSELGFVRVLSGGETEIWGHGDGSSDVINFRLGSGSGTVKARFDNDGSLRLINGSETSFIKTLSTGELDLWANGDNSTDRINLRFGSGSGAVRAYFENDGDLVANNFTGSSSGTNTGDNATNTTSNAYADGKVADNLTASTTVAPSKTAVNTALAMKANLASPTFTGTVSGITAAMVGAPSGSGTSTGTNTGDQDLSSLAPKASPALTGTPTAPTASAGTNTTQIATTAFVKTALTNLTQSGSYANVESGISGLVFGIDTQPDSNYQVIVTPGSSLVAGVDYWVNTKTTTSFRIDFTSSLTGAVALDWVIVRQP